MLDTLIYVVVNNYFSTTIRSSVILVYNTFCGISCTVHDDTCYWHVKVKLVNWHTFKVKIDDMADVHSTKLY